MQKSLPDEISGGVVVVDGGWGRKEAPIDKGSVGGGGVKRPSFSAANGGGGDCGGGDGGGGGDVGMWWQDSDKLGLCWVRIGQELG